MAIDGEGAAALLDGGGAGGTDDAAAAAAAAAAVGGGQSGAQGGGEGGGQGGAAADAEWLAHFSAEGGEADNPSNRDWLKAKGFTSLDAMAKSYRETEKAFHTKGGLVLPGADAKPEEIDAYHKAIGRPEKADDYAFDLPEGAEIAAAVPALREAAFKAGVPAAGFKALGEAFVQQQLDDFAAMKTAEDGDAGDWRKAQGDQADAKIADANRAMKALDLSADDVRAMQRGFYAETGKPGSAKVMTLLAKLGGGMAEDALIGGGAKRNFGVTGAEAQAEVDRLSSDREFGAKLMAKDPATVQRWDRLNEAIAADRDAKTRTAAG